MEFTPDDYVLCCQFDRYCKLILYHEALDYFREMRGRHSREMSFEMLPLSELDNSARQISTPVIALYFRPMAMSCISTTSWWPLLSRSCPSRARIF